MYSQRFLLRYQKSFPKPCAYSLDWKEANLWQQRTSALFLDIEYTLFWACRPPGSQALFYTHIVWTLHGARCQNPTTYRTRTRKRQPKRLLFRPPKARSNHTAKAVRGLPPTAWFWRPTAASPFVGPHLTRRRGLQYSRDAGRERLRQSFDNCFRQLLEITSLLE